MFRINSNIFYRLEKDYLGGKTVLFSLDSKETYILPMLTYNLFKFLSSNKTHNQVTDYFEHYTKENGISSEYVSELLLYFEDLINNCFINKVERS